MKLKVKHFDAKVFESKMDHLKDVNFTLFVDDIPQSQDDLTDINVLVLQEPNEYFGLHDLHRTNDLIVRLLQHKQLRLTFGYFFATLIQLLIAFAMSSYSTVLSFRSISFVKPILFVIILFDS